MATAASIPTTVITTIIAALVAVITWQQWITNQARLRHELFDRRYALFEQIAGFVAGVVQDRAVQPGTELTWRARIVACRRSSECVPTGSFSSPWTGASPPRARETG